MLIITQVLVFLLLAVELSTRVDALDRDDPTINDACGGFCLSEAGRRMLKCCRNRLIKDESLSMCHRMNLTQELPCIFQQIWGADGPAEYNRIRCRTTVSGECRVAVNKAFTTASLAEGERRDRLIAPCSHDQRWALAHCFDAPDLAKFFR